MIIQFQIFGVLSAKGNYPEEALDAMYDEYCAHLKRYVEDRLMISMDYNEKCSLLTCTVSGLIEIINEIDACENINDEVEKMKDSGVLEYYSDMIINFWRI
ncbi:MAG: hypothetical protein F6K17_17790 [Okeania sp. SIO3C4]|nr:hypothetical protein [Okeania sp. SIO3B3]NER04328.1 hypothetical protein [Okeania sp. SIO3C4]